MRTLFRLLKKCAMAGGLYARGGFDYGRAEAELPIWDSFLSGQMLRPR